MSDWLPSPQNPQTSRGLGKGPREIKLNFPIPRIHTFTMGGPKFGNFRSIIQQLILRPLKLKATAAADDGLWTT